MTNEEMIEKIKTMGFPVKVQGRSQLANRLEESEETMSQRLQKTTPKPLKEEETP